MIYKSVEKFRELERRALITDDIESQWELGNMYLSGTYIELKRDIEKAHEYYHKSAALGHVPSMKTLGNSYLDGYGNEKNFNKAIYFFKLAANHGDEYSKKKLERLLAKKESKERKDND